MAPSPPAKPVPTKSPRQARYDAAQDAPTDARHWAGADDLSAAAAHSPGVRAKLRRRSRYECANNPYLNGLVKTLAQDVVGTGPRLQLHVADGGDPARAYELTRQVEKAFLAWQRAVGLAGKMRLMHEARVRDGEAFALFTNNPALPNPVKLDLKVVECERVADPMGAALTAGDGIEYDAAGNPTRYTVLREHPGDTTWGGGEFDAVPARLVCHWFRQDRPGQLRGVPETTPMLVLGAYLRRYTQATVVAAEFAAKLAGVLSTTGGPPDGDVAEPEITSMDEVEIPVGALVTLPENWSATQFEANQPTSTYGEFKTELLNEMGRPFGAPLNVVTANSSGYNYSSARLDRQMYHNGAWVTRDDWRGCLLDRLFVMYVEEADRVGMIPDGLQPFAEWEWEWHWDGFTSIDPVKDATANQMELDGHLTTLSELCSASGKDWREVANQRAKERAYLASLGLNPDGATSPAPQGEGVPA